MGNQNGDKNGRSDFVNSHCQGLNEVVLFPVVPATTSTTSTSIAAKGCELRDVQRGTGLSTPSLASYHLDKLASSGLVAQNERGEYVANRDSVGEVIDGFSKFGVLIVPQLLFVAVLFTPLIIFFGYMALQSSWYVPALVAAALGLAALTWYETFRVWRKLSLR